MSTADDNVGFERDIKPLFRERDRASMQSIGGFDLWSHADVSARASSILEVVEAGRMPCDGAWPPDKVELFRRWTEGGMAS